MSDRKKLSSSRRKLLKTAAIGGGALGASKIALEKWHKPIVDSVLLPAHAETTNVVDEIPAEAPPEKYFLIDNDDFFYESAMNLPHLDDEAPTMIARNSASGILDRIQSLLISPAHAQTQSSVFTNEYCIRKTGDDTYRFVLSIKMTNPQDAAEYISAFVSTPLMMNVAKSVPVYICGEELVGSAQITLQNASPTAGANVRLENIEGDKQVIMKNLPYDPNANDPGDPGCSTTLRDV